MSGLLPPGFDGLEPFVEQWAIEGSAARDRARGASSAEEREAYFAAARGLVPQALELLDAKPLDRHDERERRLMNMLLSFAHVTMAVETMGAVEPRHARFREVMRITRSPAGV
jgi:hypothetical protein